MKKLLLAAAAVFMIGCNWGNSGCQDCSCEEGCCDSGDCNASCGCACG